jgi:acylaminoacyl-peptidase
MPDGKGLLLALKGPFDPEHPMEGPEIYSMRPDGSGLRRLTNRPGPDLDPVPSPDGSRIAWIGRDAIAESYGIAKLWVASGDGSRARVLVGALDRDVTHPQWSSDSRTVYFVAEDRGSVHIYAARNDGSARQVTSVSGRLHDLSLADNGEALTVRSPEELLALRIDVADSPRVVAAPNAELLKSRMAGEVEEIAFRSGGREMQGWITRPPGESGRYPLLVDFEEAPRRMCGGEFRLRAQIFAAAGFAVLCANTRGSPGYGEAFGNVLRTGFPDDVFADVMAGVDAAAGRSYVDGSRVGIVGGLMASWAIGHTDRFHAAVAVRPVMDLAAEATVGGYRGVPWDDPDLFVRHSPLYSGGGFRTPTLVIAGEHDVAADELCFALRMRKMEYARVHTDDPAVEIEAAIGWLRR